MFSPLSIVLIVVLYMGLLFGLAQWVEKRAQARGTHKGSSWVYALSMAVFFTSWTFYGSIGFAVHSGMLFLAIYIGALISVIFWWSTLKRMVAVKEGFRITSIADFISTRYRRSQRIAALVTLIALSGIAPYIALQLTAVIKSYSLITGVSHTLSPGFTGFLVTLMMIAFTIIFGIRRLDPTERHQGMVAVLVAECLVKLAAFLIVGLSVVYIGFGGFDHLVYLLDDMQVTQLTSFTANQHSGVLWLTLIVLGFAAIQLLPRQFHVAVVENSDQNHIKTAMWMFPLYLILINLFVIPIAAAGLIYELPLGSADYFMILVPQYLGQKGLTLLAFIGGFAAATGMIIVSTMTLSTMAANHLVLPFCERFSRLEPLRAFMLQIRWIMAALILLASYLLAMRLGDTYLLASMGLISFAAVLQFAPALLLGMFWRHGNSIGAMTGLLSGYLIWGYTLIIPAMIREGWLPGYLLEEGLLGFHWLRPEALFGLDYLPAITHSVIWSLLFNTLFYLLGSWFYHPQKAERSLTREFLSAMLSKQMSAKARPTGLDAYIALESKMVEAHSLLARYLNHEKAETAIERITEDLQVHNKDYITIIELMEFHRMLEQVLAGSIGAASAHSAMEERISYTEREASDLKALYSHIVGELQGQIRVVTQNPDQDEHAPSGYLLLDELQHQVDDLKNTIEKQQSALNKMEEKLEQQYQEIFDYRLEAQKLRHENEVLRQQLIKEDSGSS